MTILCYGDSNTWGYSPADGSRFPEDIRWPGVLGRCLGTGCRIIEEGLNGRTIGNFLPGPSPLNGLQYLEHLMQLLNDLDLVILYLGINDLFQGEENTISLITRQLRYAVDLILDDEFFPKPKIPEVLVLSPLPVNERIDYAEAYRKEIESSRLFYRALSEVLEDTPASVADTGALIQASRLDGVHIDEENHVKLGLALCSRLRKYSEPA